MKRPIAELHVHLEGTLSPDLTRALAARNKIQLPADLVRPDGRYAWRDFADFLKAFDAVSQVIRTPQDYADLTYDYLARCAQEGAIYVEMMASPDHAELMGGMGYTDMMEGIRDGILRAEQDHGIVGRVIITGVRHFGAERVEAVAQATAHHPDPFVVGFGLGGDEAGFPPDLFIRAYAIAHAAGLGLTVHAGEWTGPDSIRNAIKALGVTRLGHGVRAIEDESLIEELKDKSIALEVCPTSNIVLGVYPDYQAHPFASLWTKGVAVTLNSDDPPFFKASVGGEYEIARKHYALDEDDLRDVTRTAIHASFANDELKRQLLQRIDQ